MYVYIKYIYCSVRKSYYIISNILDSYFECYLQRFNDILHRNYEDLFHLRSSHYAMQGLSLQLSAPSSK